MSIRVPCAYDGLIIKYSDLPNKSQYYESTRRQTESIMQGKPNAEGKRARWSSFLNRDRTAEEVYADCAQGIFAEEIHIQLHSYTRVPKKTKDAIYNDLESPDGVRIEIKTRKSVTDSGINKILEQLKNSPVCHAEYFYLWQVDDKKTYTFAGKFKII